MKCVCEKSGNRDMRRIARIDASVNTNHGFTAYWCLSCGRCVVVNHKDGQEWWCEPDLAKEHERGVCSVDNKTEDDDVEVVYLDEKDNPHLDISPCKIGINRCSKVVTYSGTTYREGDPVDPRLAQHLAEAGCDITCYFTPGYKKTYGWDESKERIARVWDDDVKYYVGDQSGAFEDMADCELFDHLELSSIPDPPERGGDEDENVITKVQLHPHQNRVEVKFSSPMMVDADGTDHAVVSFDIKDRIQLDVAQALIEAGCSIDSVGRHENWIHFWMEDGELLCDDGRPSTHSDLGGVSQEPFHHHFELSGIPEPSEEEQPSEKDTIFDLERGDEVSFDVAQEVIQRGAIVEIIEPIRGETCLTCRMKDGKLEIINYGSSMGISKYSTFSGLVRGIKDDDEDFLYSIQSPPTPPDDRQQGDQEEDESSSDEPQGTCEQQPELDKQGILDVCWAIEKYLECCSPALSWCVEYESNHHNLNAPAIRVEGSKYGLSEVHFIGMKSLEINPIQEVEQLRLYVDRWTRRRCETAITAKVREVLGPSLEDETNE